MDTSINQMEKSQFIHHRFAFEFIAYNFMPGEMIKKIYLKHDSGVVKDYKGDFKLKDNQIEGLALALSNKFLSAFNSNRYSLYDISFREVKLLESVGVSFIDTCDYDYIEPEIVFKDFMEFGIDKFLKDIFLIEDGLFEIKPQYNPIFMFGAVFERSLLKSLKAYIRYDITEQPNIKDRLKKLNDIANNLKVRLFNTCDINKVAECLESIGFVFVFVGVDCFESNGKRYKIYFRNVKEDNNVSINGEVLQIVKTHLNFDASEIFRTHKNGLWGVAIATNSFEYVNGIQVYFCP